ncbi:MAG: Phytochrome-like protein cph2 [Frankiales bacterium]|nr:Phytochrome-like protein cph2 [Frankiales bacterium]
MSTSHRELVELLHQRAVRCVYQPVVDLEDRHVVAYEALMRGPAGSPMESPVALLNAARTQTELATLDRLAHTVALREMTSHPGAAGHALFLNIEPRGIGQQLPESLERPWQAGRDAAIDSGLQVVIELTERALLDDPGLMLWSVGEMRDLGARIALDDVGALPESLAFLPVVRPDVVKLDLRLVREHGSLEIARITHAVRAYAEASGAAVVAEGVETERDHEVALSLGATLGQGWLYGRPGGLPAELGACRDLARVPPGPEVDGQTPFEVVAGQRRPRPGDKGLLLPISHSLEDAARALAIPPLLLGCFQDVQFFTPHTQARYTDLAAGLPLVGALGTSMPASPAPGVRGAPLAEQDALVGEWNVIVLGAHYAAALVALDRGDFRTQGRDRRFDYVVTHDRDLVIAAAQTLLTRLLRREDAEESRAAG